MLRPNTYSVPKLNRFSLLTVSTLFSPFLKQIWGFIIFLGEIKHFPYILSDDILNFNFLRYLLFNAQIAKDLGETFAVSFTKMGKIWASLISLCISWFFLFPIGNVNIPSARVCCVRWKGSYQYILREWALFCWTSETICNEWQTKSLPSHSPENLMLWDTRAPGFLQYWYYFCSMSEGCL